MGGYSHHFMDEESNAWQVKTQQLSYHHTLSEWQSWDLNPHRSDSKCLRLLAMCH